MRTGTWNNHIVCIRPLGGVTSRDIRHKTKRLFLWMRDAINQNNVLHLYGLVEVEDSLAFVSEFCSKGELQDVLFNDKFNLDNNFKFSMSTDIAEGVCYLHGQNIIHGNLNTNNCYIDARWNVKIADWEYRMVAHAQQNDALTYRPITPEQKVDPEMEARKAFWRAPELSDAVGTAVTPPTPASDAFSYAMVLIEIFTRENLYSQILDDKSPIQISNEIVTDNLRPGRKFCFLLEL